MHYQLVNDATAAQAAPLACLIVDDEPQLAEALAACVRHTPSLVLVGVCTSPEQALAQLQTQAVEVLFLDIELPLLAGLALLRALASVPAVVLTSSYPDCNLQDAGYGVVDCLVKPFGLNRFAPVAARLASRAAPASMPPLAAPAFAPSQADGLYFWVDQQLVQVRLADVLYVECLPLGCRVRTQCGEFITTQPFSCLADQLPEPQFLRVNPSFVVALRQAVPVAGNALAVGGQRIAVGPALQDEMLARAFQTSLWGA